MDGLERGASIFGESIANAINQYHQEHLQHDQLYGQVDAMQRMLWSNKSTGELVVNPPMDETGKPLNKDLISPFNTKVIESYKNFNRKDAAYAKGQLSALGRMGMDLLHHQITQPQQYPVQVPGVGNVQLTGPQAAAYSASVQKANRPASARTTNPDLNFTHAVNAHNAQVKQVEDYFHQNYGVGPADILNDKSLIGYVFDKNKKPVEAKEDQTPDAYSVQTSLTMSPSGKYINDPAANKRWGWITKDQLEAIKPQAKAWQQLQQNPPKREDYRTPAPSFVPDARALQIRAAYKAGKISPEEAIKALQAQ